MQFNLIQKPQFALQASLYCGSVDAEGGNISLNLKYWNFGCAKEADTDPLAEVQARYEKAGCWGKASQNPSP